MLLRCAANTNSDTVGSWTTNPISAFPSRAEAELSYVPRRVAEGAPQRMSVIGTALCCVNRARVTSMAQVELLQVICSAGLSRLIVLKCPMSRRPVKQ